MTALTRSCRTCNGRADGVVIIIVDPKQNLADLEHVEVFAAEGGGRRGE